MKSLLRRISRESRMALFLTVIVLVVVAGAVVTLYLLISIKSVQHSNGRVLDQINVLLHNHSTTVDKLNAICRAIPHCTTKN